MHILMHQTDIQPNLTELPCWWNKCAAGADCHKAVMKDTLAACRVPCCMSTSGKAKAFPVMLADPGGPAEAGKMAVEAGQSGRKQNGGRGEQNEVVMGWGKGYMGFEGVKFGSCQILTPSHTQSTAPGQRGLAPAILTNVLLPRGDLCDWPPSHCWMQK